MFVVEEMVDIFNICYKAALEVRPNKLKQKQIVSLKRRKTYQSVRRCNPEDIHLHTCRRENVLI